MYGVIGKNVEKSSVHAKMCGKMHVENKKKGQEKMCINLSRLELLH